MKAGFGTSCVHGAFLPYGAIFSEKFYRSYGIGCQHAHSVYSMSEQRFFLFVLLLKEEQSCSYYRDLAQILFATLLQSHRSGAVSVYKIERTPALYQRFVICDH